MGELRIVPLSLRQANAAVEAMHRHHKPVRGHRFSLGLMEGDLLHGAATVGRPVARGANPWLTAEVTRLVTDGTPNACSMLYGACARVCREMGFDRIQTYILEEEPGTSLKASGWRLVGMTKGGDWNNSKVFAAQGRRTDQPMQPKQRWELVYRGT